MSGAGSSRKIWTNLSKVVAFTVFGDNPMYTVGAVKNADLVAEYYPEFEAWYYVGRSVPASVVAELDSRPNTRVELMDRPEDQTATFWRFFAAAEPSVEVLLSRDVDSRIGEREAAAVREWLDSPYDFHIMRDHPWHNVPILAGMFGARGRALDVVGKWGKIWYMTAAMDHYQTDQRFLGSAVYEIVRTSALAHDEYFHFEDELSADQKRPFPTPRVGGEFCCQAYDENDNLRYPKHQYEGMEL